MTILFVFEKCVNKLHDEHALFTLERKARGRQGLLNDRHCFWSPWKFFVRVLCFGSPSVEVEASRTS